MSLIVKRAHLTRDEIAAFPQGAVWNAFVDLLSLSEPWELSDAQRPAQCAFWYDAEVQNGGHLQYFLNRGLEEAQETTTALETLGAEPFSRVLKEAVVTWNTKERSIPKSTEEYVEQALEGEFNEADASYYALTPPLIEILEKHLAEFQSRYISIDD